MAESDSDRTNILAALLAVLVAVNDPVLTVVQGPPWAIVQDKQTHFWYEGDSTDFETVGGDRSVLEKFKIQVFWREPANAASLLAQMTECWNANRSIQQGLQLHSTLGELVQKTEVQDTTAGLWVHFSGITYYSLEIPLHLWAYSADTVGR